MKEIRDDSVLNFPLGQLFGYNPNKLCTEPKLKELDAFVISLSLIYNDFKTLILVWEILREFKPNPPSKDVIDKNYGQFSGMELYLFRLQSSTLVELIQTIEDSTNLFEAVQWERTLKKLSEKQLGAWENLLNLSQSKKGDDGWLRELRVFLVKIRSHGGFHYQTGLIANGFSNFFRESTPQSKYAYAWLGKNWEESRFLFADAAIMTVINTLKSTLSLDFNEQFRKFLEDLNISIRAIVEGYLKIRQVSRTILE